jgi:hypothetical protein
MRLYVLKAQWFFIRIFDGQEVWDTSDIQHIFLALQGSYDKVEFLFDVTTGENYCNVVVSMLLEYHRTSLNNKYLQGTLTLLMNAHGFEEPKMTWNERPQGERDLNDYDLPGISILFWTKNGHKLSFFQLSDILPKASNEFEHFLRAFPTQVKKNMGDLFNEESSGAHSDSAKYSAELYCRTTIKSSAQLDVLLNDRALKVISFRCMMHVS